MPSHIPWIHGSVSSSTLHCLDWCSFVVSLEVNSPLLEFPNLVSWEFYVPSYTGHCLRTRPCLLSGSSPEGPESQWQNSSLSEIICLEGMTPLALGHSDLGPVYVSQPLSCSFYSWPWSSISKWRQRWTNPPLNACWQGSQGSERGQMQAADSVMSWLTASLLAAKADVPWDASQLNDG